MKPSATNLLLEIFGPRQLGLMLPCTVDERRKEDEADEMIALVLSRNPARQAACARADEMLALTARRVVDSPTFRRSVVKKNGRTFQVIERVIP